MNPDELTWLAIPPEPVGAWARLQDDLVHKYHPKREDLLEIWNMAYPDRPIRDGGIRCFQCDGSGVAHFFGFRPGVDDQPEPCGTMDCPSCDGSGWARKAGGGEC